MRRILIAAVELLLCCAKAQAQVSPELFETATKQTPLKLLITTYNDYGVLIEDFLGASGLHSYTIDGPHIEVVLQEGASLVIDDLDDPEASGKVDWEQETLTFAGNLVLEIQQDGLAVSRLTVRKARVLYGRMDGEFFLRKRG